MSESAFSQNAYGSNGWCVAGSCRRLTCPPVKVYSRGSWREGKFGVATPALTPFDWALLTQPPLPVAMDENFAPLRFSSIGPDYIGVTSAPKTGYIPLHLIPLLPIIQAVPRDLCIDAREPLFCSEHIIKWVRGELDHAQAARVEKLLKDKGVVGVHFPLQATPARGISPSQSQDSDTYKASSALLALREASSQVTEDELPNEADVAK